ncbi:MAG: universal stress protein [Methylocystis sp.]|nr:universal stress protein [Methylocystis sp.]
MFKTILNANDGSEPAFRAFALALEMAKQNQSALHMICVEELPNLADFIEEVKDSTALAERRFEAVRRRALDQAAAADVSVQIHVVVGHPVRDIVQFANDLEAELLVIGATGHSAFYERMIGSRADRIVQLASCPVMVVK